MISPGLLSAIMASGAGAEAEPPPPLPGEVTVLNDAALDDGGTYTAAAGTNRLLVYIAGGRGATVEDEPWVTGVNYGAVAMTEAVFHHGVSRRLAGIWFLKEADIPSGQQTISVVSVNGFDATLRGRIYTLGGVDQATPLRATTSGENGQDDGRSLTANSSLGVVDGDLTLSGVVWRLDRTGTLAPSAGFTTDLKVFSDDHTRAAAQRPEDATTSYTPGWSHEGGFIENNAIGVWATVASGEAEPPPPPPGEVTVLNDAALNEDGTYTAAAGDDRLLVYVAGGRGGDNINDPWVTGVAFGAIPMTEAVFQHGALRRVAGVWYLKETDIPSGSQTLSVTWIGDTPDATLRGRVYTLAGVNQTSPFRSTASGVEEESGSATVTASSSLSVEAGDLTLSGGNWRNDRTASLAPSTGFSIDLMVFADNQTRAVARRVEEANTSITPSWTHAGGDTSTNVVAVWATVASGEGEPPPPPPLLMPSYVSEPDEGSNEVFVAPSLQNQDTTFTVPSGLSNTKLVALVSQNTSHTVESITWDEGGEDEVLTKEHDIIHTDNVGTRIEVWYLDNPTPGDDKTIRAVQSQGPASNKVYWYILFKDAKPGPPLFVGAEAASASDISDGITIPAPGEAQILTAYRNSRTGEHDRSVTGTGHLERANDLNTGGGWGFGYREAEAAAGYTLGWEQASGSSARQVLALIGIEPV